MKPLTRIIQAAMLAVFLLPGIALGQQKYLDRDQAFVAASGTTVTFSNEYGATIGSFTEQLVGSPSAVSIVLKGCIADVNGNPLSPEVCDTIETNTSTSSSIRQLKATTIYDYFKVTPTFSGGTSPAVFIKKNLAPLAKNSSGSGSGGSVNTVFTRSGPDITAQTGDYDFSQISGSVAASQLPNPGASSLGGIESLANVAHKFISSISTSGVPVATQPDYSDLTGLPTLAANTTSTAHQFFTAYNSSTGAFTKAQPAEADLGVTDITTNDVSTSAHGLAPKAPNDARRYLDGTGAYSNPEKILFASAGNTDTVACPNNTTSNFATTYTIPANYLVANKILRIFIGFSLTSSSSPPTSAFRMTIGGTAVIADNAQSFPNASVTNIPVSTTIYIQGSAAASGSAAVYTHQHPLAGVNGVFAPFENSTTQIVQPVNLATNGTLVIQPILFCGANTAGNSLTLQQMIVEGLN